MSDLARNMIISAILLGLFAIVGTTLLALTNETTAPRIAVNQRAVVLNKLHELIPPDQHDNDLFADAIEVTAPDYLGSNEPVAVYRARRGKEPVAAIIASVAPDGYNGRIHLLVAVRYNGTLAGVRVARHLETPGLGDGIDIRKSDWIKGFKDRSLNDPPLKDWHVKRDGGVFDQLTGATITPRAVVKAVRKTLEFFQSQREHLFTPVTVASSDEEQT